NVMRDRARALAREQAAARREAAEEAPPEEQPIDDDRLRLLFACCHPVLGDEAQVALTLRMVGGLSTPEIAPPSVLAVATIAQRLVRAKRTIADAGVPFAIPGPDDWPARLPRVLSVIYLIFNEGYATTTGESLTRPVLCAEALRLAGLLAELVPHE